VWGITSERQLNYSIDNIRDGIVAAGFARV